ncbi:MAG: LacI family DNA-binding transcriptional regulator [Bacteroidetes bacterium]|nr:LacI family DNA-binding transcriptional regulator [Bacteroidota bacterium]
MKKPTLKDVAREAGVSLGMASRVLGKYGSYSEETKNKVQAAAKQLDYKKHAIAKSLKLSNSRIIGIVISNISSVFWATITRAVEDVASKSGYHVIIGNTDENSKKEREYLETFCEGFVDGLIVAPSQDNHTLIKKMNRSGLPIVALDRKVSGLHMPSVTIDNINGSHEAVTYLLKKGHSNIGIIAGSDGIMTSDHRLEGYRKALTDFGVPINKDFIVYADFQMDRAYEKTEELISGKNPPTAIFVCNEIMAKGAYRALQDHDIAIGKDIDLIGFGDTDWATLVRPTLTCIRQPVYSMGLMACDSLLRLINNSDSENQNIEQVCMKTELILRDSC